MLALALSLSFFVVYFCQPEPFGLCVTFMLTFNHVLPIVCIEGKLLLAFVLSLAKVLLELGLLLGSLAAYSLLDEISIECRAGVLISVGLGIGIGIGVVGCCLLFLVARWHCCCCSCISRSIGRGGVLDLHRSCAACILQPVALENFAAHLVGIQHVLLLSLPPLGLALLLA